jgi:hypothetical protein
MIRRPCRGLSPVASVNCNTQSNHTKNYTVDTPKYQIQIVLYKVFKRPKGEQRARQRKDNKSKLREH